MIRKHLTAITTALMLAATPVLAQQALDSKASSVHFASVKNSSIAEVHHFTGLSGSIADNGKAEVTIQLASVETLIPIRNERMRDILFMAAQMPVASISTQLDKALLAKLKPGVVVSETVPLTVALHGKEKTYNAALRIVVLADGRIQVSTEAPVMVNAADHDLAAGIEKLREIAMLNNIATVVPVTATLVFQPGK